MVPHTELRVAFGRCLLTQYGGQRPVLVAVDGRTMWCTIPHGKSNGVDLLAADLPKEGVVLARVAVATMTNELIAAPVLLERVDLRSRVVCRDAKYAQWDLSVQILAGGGACLWFLYENQLTRLADVDQFFSALRVTRGWHRPPPPRQTPQAVRKAHGRLKIRHLTSIVDGYGIRNWPGVQPVFQLERQVAQVHTDYSRCQTGYGLSGCTMEKADAEQRLRWTQAHWGMWSGLHYRHDATLGEYRTRITNGRFAEELSSLENLVVSLTPKPQRNNRASARHQFDVRTTELLARVHDC